MARITVTDNDGVIVDTFHTEEWNLSKSLAIQFLKSEIWEAIQIALDGENGDENNG